MKDLKPLPTITCGVLCHNEVNSIAKCIHSIMDESNQLLLSKVWIVDNASTDGSAEFLKNLAQIYPKLEIHFSKVNQIGGARQWIVDHCSTDLLMFTDGDCEVPKNWVSQLLKAYINLRDQHPTGGVCGPNRLPENYVWQKSINLFLDSSMGHGFSPQAYKPSRPVRTDHLPTTNALFSVSALKKTEGFKSHWMVGEDVQMGRQLRDRGYSLWLLPNPVVYNDCADNFDGWILRMRKFGSARWQHSPWTSWPLFLGGLLLALVLAYSLSPWAFFAGMLMFLSFEVLIRTLKNWMERKSPSTSFSMKGIAYFYGLVTLRSYFLGWLQQGFYFLRRP